MKKSKILFPFTIENINPKSYYFAIDLARKFNYELIILLINESIKESDFFLKNRNKQSRLHESYLNLLKLNGIYHGSYNQWNSYEDLSFSIITNNTEFGAAIYTYFLDKKVETILLDFNTFFDKVYTTRLLEYLSRNTKKLWVMPQENKFNETDPNLKTEQFNSLKKDAFKETLCNTRLYDLPEELGAVKSDFTPHLSII